jgi:hypothetical protein
MICLNGDARTPGTADGRHIASPTCAPKPKTHRLQGVVQKGRNRGRIRPGTASAAHFHFSVVIVSQLNRHRARRRRDPAAGYDGRWRCAQHAGGISIVRGGVLSLAPPESGACRLDSFLSCTQVRRGSLAPMGRSRERNGFRNAALAQQPGMDNLPLVVSA